jgi:hypothetical protein
MRFAANGQTVENNFYAARIQKIAAPANFCLENNDQPVKWNGQYEKWIKGKGTKEDPFLIEKPDHLAFMAYLIKNGEGAKANNIVFKGVYFKLMINIDLNGIEWTPIGYRVKDSYHYFFGGHFDGNGHTIKGLFVTSKDEWLGLFGGIKDGSVTCLKVSGKIERKDPPTPAPIPKLPELPQPPPTYTYYDPWIGGIVGYAENTIIQNCYSECNIHVENTNPTYLGGIAGACIGTGGVFFCANTGNMTASSTGFLVLGGIVGYTNTTVSNSYNTGTISSFDSSSDTCYRGGIAGNSTGNIIDCYNMGTIFGDCDAQRFSGGIVAVALDNSIENCYNAGGISHTDGGVIIGNQHNSNVNASNCYYRTVPGITNSFGGTPIMEDFMKTIEMVMLLGSAFKQDVDPYFNQGYPILSNNALSTGITESISSNSTIIIYPNPTTGQLTIMNNEQLTMKNIELFDMYGRNVGAYACGCSEITIDLSYLSSGIYFLQIQMKDRVVRKKIVISDTRKI